MIQRALFVGLGGVGQRHLRNLRARLGTGLDVIAYRVRGERLELSDQLTQVEGGDVERSFGVRTFSDLSLALAERPDIAFITNPTSLHVETALKCLEGGSDLFIEKPLAADLSGVDELKDALLQKERIAFVGYQLRFHPGFQILGDFIASGQLGEVHHGEACISEALPGFHPYEDYRRMYASRRDLGGGVTLTQIHEIDLIYSLFGMPDELVSFGGKVSRLEIDVEDCASSLLRYSREDGGHFVIRLHQDYLGRPRSRHLRICGEHGAVELDLITNRLVFDAADGTRELLFSDPAYPRNQLFQDELRHFLSAVEQRSRPLVSIEEAECSLKIALALRASQVTRSTQVLTEKGYVAL